MIFSNANSFKAKIKNIAKEKEIHPQQIMQNYLIEQILRLISKSGYKDAFIVKGGYLISSFIGIDKRTTMDLDVTIKGLKLSSEKIMDIFREVLSINESRDSFTFYIESIKDIRVDSEYGGFEIKINASFDSLREVVFIDITTGDKITPKEMDYSLKSVFDNDYIDIFAYNIETLLAEKLETVLHRGSASSRPRDRYDIYTIWHMRKTEINIEILRLAIINTAGYRGTVDVFNKWEEQLDNILNSDYQKQLWRKYQKSFPYAQEVKFEDSCKVIEEILEKVEETYLLEHYKNVKKNMQKNPKMHTFDSACNKLDINI
ncbi:MAG: nucleotidyl transferase AbiEii/AbiGii toxin family protein [Lachnospiraceae bacterium]|jgi:predicted nucleotidyltransferase component of viral defense system|nr:nucleotidyl transferase AbiEii/AbiGii toxin family protein [Lachnospiraceae bacterium]